MATFEWNPEWFNGDGGTDETDWGSVITSALGGFGRNMIKNAPEALSGYLGGQERKRAWKDWGDALSGGLTTGYQKQTPYLQGEVDSNKAILDNLLSKFNEMYDMGKAPHEMAAAMAPHYADAVRDYNTALSDNEVPQSLKQLQEYQLRMAGDNIDRQIAGLGLTGSGAGMRMRNEALNPLQLGFAQQGYDAGMARRNSNISNLNNYYKALTGNPLDMGRFGGNQINNQSSLFGGSMRNFGNANMGYYGLMGGIKGESIRGQAGETADQLRVLAASAGNRNSGGGSGGDDVMGTIAKAIPIVASFF